MLLVKLVLVSLSTPVLAASAHAVNATGTNQNFYASGVDNTLQELEQNFQTQNNRISPVAITHFKPLSHTSQSGKSSATIGVALLTQDDVVFSTGFGATFAF